jgi:hypothetical protein
MPEDPGGFLSIIKALEDGLEKFVDDPCLGGIERRHQARANGSENFSPAMLPRLWKGSICPYSTPEFRAEFFWGFFSVATWFMLDRFAHLILENPSLVSDENARYLQLESLIDWYTTPHEEREYNMVPAGGLLLDIMHEMKSKESESGQEANQESSEEDSQEAPEVPEGLQGGAQEAPGFRLGSRMEPIKKVGPELVRCVLNVVDRGLIGGAGSGKPGDMCVEQAVAYAMGEMQDTTMYDSVRGWSR